MNEKYTFILIGAPESSCVAIVGMKNSKYPLWKHIESNKMTSDSKKWTLPSPNIVMECIEKWRNLDLRKMSDSEIDEELSDFLDTLGVYTISRIKHKPFILWRVRIFKDYFYDLSHCWEPPAQKTPIGRCNARENPVLYVSEKIETTFEELNVKTDKQVYVIEYDVSEELDLIILIPKQLCITNDNNEPIYDQESMLSYQILREFIRSEFLKPVGKGTEYLHKISSSICRIWFNSDDSDGWIYPSVQIPTNDNIALKPQSARKKLKIKNVRIVRLVEKEKIKNHREKIKSHPFYNLISMAMETDFKGVIKDGQISWHPSTEVQGIYLASRTKQMF